MINWYEGISQVISREKGREFCCDWRRSKENREKHMKSIFRLRELMAEMILVYVQRNLIKKIIMG